MPALTLYHSQHHIQLQLTCRRQHHELVASVTPVAHSRLQPAAHENGTAAGAIRMHEVSIATRCVAHAAAKGPAVAVRIWYCCWQLMVI